MKNTNSKLCLLLASISFLFSCESDSSLEENDLNTQVTINQSITINDIDYEYQVIENKISGEYELIESENTQVIENFFNENDDYAEVTDLDTGETVFYSKENRPSYITKNEELNSTGTAAKSTSNIDNPITIELYDDINYGGESYSIFAGDRFASNRLADLNFAGAGFNNKTSSFIIENNNLQNTNTPDRVTITFYEDTFSEGRSKTFSSTFFRGGIRDLDEFTLRNAGFPRFRRTSWNNAASSVSFSLTEE